MCVLRLCNRHFCQSGSGTGEWKRYLLLQSSQRSDPYVSAGGPPYVYTRRASEFCSGRSRGTDLYSGSATHISTGGPTHISTGGSIHIVSDVSTRDRNSHGCTHSISDCTTCVANEDTDRVPYPSTRYSNPSTRYSNQTTHYSNQTTHYPNQSTNAGTCPNQRWYWHQC